MRTVMVIVFHSGEKDLARCIESVSPNLCEVIVVDVSPSAAGKSVCDASGHTTWVDGSRNGGYAWAANLGVDFASTKFDGSIDVVIVSNPDVEYTEAALVNVIETASRTNGVCYPLQVSPEGCVMRHSVMPAAGRSEFIRGWLFPFYRSSRVREADFVRDEAIRSEDVVAIPDAVSGSGGCIVVSYPAWRAIGGMDQRFFLFAEDRMFSDRAHRGLHPVNLCGGAKVVHEGGFNSRGVSMLQYTEFIASQRIAWKAFDYSGLTLLVAVQVLGLVLRAIRSLPTGDFDRARLFSRLALVVAFLNLDVANLSGEDGVRVRVIDRYPFLATAEHAR